MLILYASVTGNSNKPIESSSESDVKLKNDQNSNQNKSEIYKNTDNLAEKYQIASEETIKVLDEEFDSDDEDQDARKMLNKYKIQQKKTAIPKRFSFKVVNPDSIDESPFNEEFTSPKGVSIENKFFTKQSQNAPSKTFGLCP